MVLKVSMPELRYGTALEIRSFTKTSVGVTFGFTDEQIYDAKRLERQEEEITEYTVEKFEGRGKRKNSSTNGGSGEESSTSSTSRKVPLTRDEIGGSMTSSRTPTTGNRARSTAWTPPSSG